MSVDLNARKNGIDKLSEIGRIISLLRAGEDIIFEIFELSFEITYPEIVRAESCLERRVFIAEIDGCDYIFDPVIRKVDR